MPEASARQMVLTTALGTDLFFQAMHGKEDVSRLFEYHVSALSTSATLSPDDILGTGASVSIEIADDVKRHFHGIVASFGINGSVGRYYRYHLVLRPWLWLLTRSQDIRIFQDQTALDIVGEIFNKYEHTFSNSASGAPPARPYCVQYRETDFNFVSRLLEDEGLGYFFKHSASGHEMVLFDQTSQLAPTSGYETVRFYADPDKLAAVQGFEEWRMTQEIKTGSVILGDWNFETPSTSLLSTAANATRAHANASFEVYDFPAGHGVKADGDTLATRRLDEYQARFGRYSGKGNTPGVAAGTLFTLAEHDRDDLNAEYLVLQTQVDMQISGYESASGPNDPNLDTHFEIRIVAQPSAEPYKPQRTATKPFVQGPQTALVVGDADAGDILTDEHGRVKVQFHWDRVGTKTAASSCWLRVASPMAGNGWGFISIPRIGQEVVVDFLEGDPDRPLVTGRLHNPEQKPPYELPANATVSTFKSRSKLGAAADFNELRFEDKAGEEYVLLHAQKDRLEFVEGTLKAKIDVDEHRTTTGKRKEKVASESHLHVVGVAKQKFDDKLHVTATGGILQKSDDLWSLNAAKDITAETGAALSLKSAKDFHLKVGANWGGEASQNVYIKGGTNVVIEAGTQISIKVGGSSIVIGSDGVSITGPMVKINSGGSAGSGTAPSPVAPTAPEAPEDPELPEDPLTHR